MYAGRTTLGFNVGAKAHPVEGGNARIADLSQRLEVASNRIMNCATLLGQTYNTLFGPEPEQEGRPNGQVHPAKLPVEAALNVLFHSIDELERRVGRLTG